MAITTSSSMRVKADARCLAMFDFTTVLAEKQEAAAQRRRLIVSSIFFALLSLVNVEIEMNIFGRTGAFKFDRVTSEIRVAAWRCDAICQEKE